MNKIKVIDLFNMISKGEEVPKKIMWKDELFDNDVAYFLYEYIGDCSNKDIKLKLNCNVDIIEEDKKIEKLKSLNNVGNSSCLEEFKDKQQLNNHLLKDKINELIDKVNNMENKQ